MIQVIHRQCKQPAFYALIPRPIPGTTVKAANFVKLDGTTPVVGEAVICGSCGKGLKWSVRDLDWPNYPELLSVPEGL